jgi:hypothetical protein
MTHEYSVDFGALSGTPIAESQPFRKGLLASPALTSRIAFPNMTAPFRRAAFVINRLLCLDLPSPPAGLDIKIPAADKSLTQRQRLEAHGSVQPCAACHQVLDPVAFSLEVYDYRGVYRTEDAGLKLETSGHLRAFDGHPKFETNEHLASLIAESYELESCMYKRVSQYFGRQASIERTSCTVTEAARDPEKNQFVAAILALLRDSRFY